MTKLQYLSLTAFFPYKMLREGRGKQTLNSTTNHQLLIYLFATLPYAQLKETNWVQQKCWPLSWWRECRAKPSMLQGTGDRIGWDFPGGDATAWKRALRLLLRQSTGGSMRRSGEDQALWSAVTCIPQPQLGQNGNMNFMVVPGLAIYGPGSVVFRGTC